MPKEKSGCVGCNHRTLWILSRTLEDFVDDPPEVKKPQTTALYDPVVYRKHVSDLVRNAMRDRGILVDPVEEWEDDYCEHTSAVGRLPLPHIAPSASEYLRVLQKARNDASSALKSHDDDMDSDGEWMDVDTSVGSSWSSAKSSDRVQRLAVTKQSLMSKMRESATKKAIRISRLFTGSQNNSSLRKKAPPVSTLASDSNNGEESERNSRALKRQASTVVSSEAKKQHSESTTKATKGRAPSADRSEFARSQNSRIQLVKEKREQQEKVRQKQLETKMQKKVSKGAQAKATATFPTAKVITPTKPVVPSKAKKGSSFAKPLQPPPVVAIKSKPPAKEVKNSPVMSMQSKAKGGLAKGDIAKQAMFQSMLAAGDDAVPLTNSTFLPGSEGAPNFEITLSTPAANETYFVAGAANAKVANGTFVSKPGLVSPRPEKVEAVVSGNSSFADSFNETYRNYGIDDLNSDSDNTDDENAPNKPIPKWAETRTARFKNRVRRQRTSGDEIPKYGEKNIYMAPHVDLEHIFAVSSTRFKRHNTSSGMWNDTQDFIRD